MAGRRWLRQLIRAVWARPARQCRDDIRPHGAAARRGRRARDRHACSPTRSRTTCRNPWTLPAWPPGAPPCPRTSRPTHAATSTPTSAPLQGWQSSMPRISTSRSARWETSWCSRPRSTMPTRFMRLFGHDTVTVAATTRINREVRQMELALVLDNTGSMWGTPFTTMQAAAKDLVDIVYGEEDTSPNLFVAVVPYVATVNMGNWRTAWLAAGDPARGPGNPYAPSTWKGCVMARTGGLDRTDDPPLPPRSEAISIPMPPTMTGARRATHGPTSGSTRRTTPMAPISVAGRPFYPWSRSRADRRRSARRHGRVEPRRAPRATRAWPGVGACFRRAGVVCGVATLRTLGRSTTMPPIPTRSSSC